MHNNQLNFLAKEFTTVYHKHNLITIGQSFPSYFPLELLIHELIFTVRQSNSAEITPYSPPSAKVRWQKPKVGNQKTKSHKKEKEVDEAPTPGQKQRKSIGNKLT